MSNKLVEQLRQYPDRMLTDPDGLMEEAADEIERLRAVVDAAQQLIEQGLPKRTKQDQWNAWHILKDALEDSDE